VVDRLMRADDLMETGDMDDPSNLQGMCHACHSRKTAIEDGRWG